MLPTALMDVVSRLVYGKTETLEDYIRELEHLPARSGDTRVEDETRTKLQQPFGDYNPHARSRTEQYADTAARVEPKENMDTIDGGLEDAKVKAARKRLGRE